MIGSKLLLGSCGREGPLLECAENYRNDRAVSSGFFLYLTKNNNVSEFNHIHLLS
jgi:hypothetical protein